MKAAGPSRDPLWIAGLAAVAAAAFAVYAGALDAPFFYDDYQNVVDRPAVGAGPLSAAFEGPTLRPVANWSFALNRRLGGAEPRGFRLVNVGVHAANAVWVALLAQVTLGLLPRPPAARTRRAIALVSGLLFALHPVQIQAVTYVVQRMTSLATAFCLLALLAWLRGRRCDGAPRRRWWTGAGLAWLLALGCKEIAIALPAAVWLYEWLFFRRLDAAFLRRSLPWAAPLAAAAALGLAWAHLQPGAYAGRPFDFRGRALTELRVVVFYLSLVVWPAPSRLNLLHEFPLSRSLLDPPTTALSALALLALAALAARSARRAPLAGFGIAWLLLMLALESFGLPLALLYEHRLYLPMVGVALAAPWALFAACSMRSARALPIACAGLALLAAATWSRNAVWRDELGFWSDVAAKSPGVAAARSNLGLALQRAGRTEEALTEHRAAARLDPRDAEARNSLGAALLALGRGDEAIRVFEEALRIAPDHHRARFNLGRALVLAGRLDEGAAEVERAVALAPWDASAWNGLGAVRELQGRLPESAAAFEQALRLDPQHAAARANLTRMRSSAGAPAPDPG